MGLIDEKNVRTFSAASLPEKAFQMGGWIKNIIVVADYRIHPGGDVETQLKRADIPFFTLI